MWLIVFFVFNLTTLNGGDLIDVDLSVDRRNWLDPLDPLSHQPGSKEKHGLEGYEGKQHCFLKEDFLQHISPDIGRDPTLKHIITNILKRLNIAINSEISYVDCLVKVYLSKEDIAAFQNYLKSDDESLTQRERIRTILENFIVKREDDKSLLMFIGEKISVILPLLNLCILLPALCIIVTNKLSIHSLISLVLLASFFASIYTTYNRKYQEIIAARASRMNSVYDDCKSNSVFMDFVDKIKGLMFMREKNKCQQAHEDLLISPYFQISMLDVISDVFSNFMFLPMSIFGHYCKEFINEFYRDSTIWLILPKTIILILMSVVFLLTILGYRLRTPFVTIEPTDLSPLRILRTYSMTNTKGNDEMAVRSSGDTSRFIQYPVPQVRLEDGHSKKLVRYRSKSLERFSMYE